MGAHDIQGATVIGEFINGSLALLLAAEHDPRVVHGR